MVDHIEILMVTKETFGLNYSVMVEMYVQKAERF